MTEISFQDGKVVMRDGKVGTERGCCCEAPCRPCCDTVRWTLTLGDCANSPPQVFDNQVYYDGTGLPDFEDCYSYFVWEDYDCQNPLVGRDCGAGEQCNIYARVRVSCATSSSNEQGPCGESCSVGTIEYRNPDTGEWGGVDRFASCECQAAFVSLTAAACPHPVDDCANNACVWVWFPPTQTWLADAECPAPCACPVAEPPGPPVGQEELFSEQCLSPPP